MNGLSGGDCYTWTASFNPQTPCATETPSGSGSCASADWFWIIAAGIAALAVLTKK